jgi:heme/copper-type cytochrome/quinol oxidase subunit 2
MNPLLVPPDFACAVCFGAAGSNVTHAMALAIMFMLGMLVLVLGSFAGFFFYLRQRAKNPPSAYDEMMRLKSAAQPE